MDFGKLNEVSQQVTFLPFKPWRDLQHGSDYTLTELKAVNTKYGESVVATIADEFKVFLPGRIVKFLLADDIQFKEMSGEASNHRLAIHYIGGKYGLCEFKPLDLSI